MIIIYSLPNCSKCENLKNFLKDKNILFEIKSFNTEIHTELVMNNNFGDPPILSFNNKLYSSTDIFKQGKIEEKKVMRILN